jgi:hypothetical protein
MGGSGTEVDWDEIGRWSRQEGAIDKFEAFRKRFEEELNSGRQ